MGEAGGAQDARRGVWTVVVAAGSGNRFGGAKQFAALGEQRVLDWSIDVATRTSEGVVVVVAAEHVAAERARQAPAGGVQVIAGAVTRAGSVRAGLRAVPPSAEVVLVHDAARPLASPELFARVVDAVRAGASAVVPGVAAVDTMRHVTGGTVPREELVAVQTPQGFPAGALRAAHAGEPEATDDASLIEAAGGIVVIVPGEPTNLKLTNPVDLVVARALLAHRGER
jgi:2-C-methyl-D-erythritol 4-phosphate cytidylyltransferase